MKTKNIFFLAPLLTILLLSGCSQADYYDADYGTVYPDQKYDANAENSSSLASLMKDKKISDTSFADSFASRLLESLEADNNVVFSPYLLQMSLCWLAQHETDDVQAKLLESMGLTYEDLQAANRFFAFSSAFLRENLSKELTFSHSVWAQAGYTIESSSWQDESSMIAPHISYVDFEQTEETKSYIWDWMKGDEPQVWESTHLFSYSLPADLKMLLFGISRHKDAFWYPFKETVEKPFFLSDGSQTTHLMATGVFDALPFVENEKMSAVALPYKNGITSLCLFLPKEGYSLRDIVSEVSLVVGSSKACVDLTMPLFDYFSLEEVNLPRLRMGFPCLWEERGVLSGLDPNLYPIALCQQTQLEWAPLSDMMDASKTSKTAEKTLLLDRPFLFTLIENSTGLVLMEGQISSL
ncbi:MAG: hypothetical protein J6T94_00230 [Bacteroidaceae bacterium]|nr:hypothetical protein [Bacteroidaceae bacterium]